MNWNSNRELLDRFHLLTAEEQQVSAQLQDAWRSDADFTALSSLSSDLMELHVSKQVILKSLDSLAQGYRAETQPQ